MWKKDNAEIDFTNDEETLGMIKTGCVKNNNLIMRKILNVLEAQQFAVYQILLSHRNKSNECSPTISLIAKECGVSITTIKKSLNLLKEKGFIEINSDKKGLPNKYHFPMEKF